MNDEDIPPRDEEDPRMRYLARRSGGPAVSLWVIVILIAMAAAAVYVVSALL